MEQTWAVSLLTILNTMFCSHLGQKGGKRIRIVIYFFFPSIIRTFAIYCFSNLQKQTNKKNLNGQENKEKKSNQDSTIQLYYLSCILVGQWLVKANCIFHFELQISQKLSLYWQLHSGGLDHKIQIISYSPFMG